MQNCSACKSKGLVHPRPCLPRKHPDNNSQLPACFQPLLHPLTSLQRMQRCKDKGFEALDPDNVDGYANDNGMGLTPEQQITYNKWLAQTGHDLGLAVGLKNDLDQLGDLVNDFDFFVNEQCAKYKECNLYKPAQDRECFLKFVLRPSACRDANIGNQTQRVMVASKQSVLAPDAGCQQGENQPPPITAKQFARRLGYGIKE